MNKKLTKKDIKQYFNERLDKLKQIDEQKKITREKAKNKIANFITVVVLTIITLFLITLLIYKCQWNYMFINLGFIVIPVYLLLTKSKKFVVFYNSNRGRILIVYMLVLMVCFLFNVSYDLKQEEFYNLLILVWTIYSCMIVFVTIWRITNDKRKKKYLSELSNVKAYKLISTDAFISILLIINVVINVFTTFLYFWNVTNYNNSFLMKPALYTGGFLTCILAFTIIIDYFIEPLESYYILIKMNREKKKIERLYNKIKDELKKRTQDSEIDSDYEEKVDKEYQKRINEIDKRINETLKKEIEININ